MAEIATKDEASTPVLDWEKEDQKLHITDPFFAFFLKWGFDNDPHYQFREWNRAKEENLKKEIKSKKR
jgi:hypothetical protein